MPRILLHDQYRNMATIHTTITPKKSSSASKERLRNPRRNPSSPCHSLETQKKTAHPSKRHSAPNPPISTSANVRAVPPGLKQPIRTDTAPDPDLPTGSAPWIYANPSKRLSAQAPSRRQRLTIAWQDSAPPPARQGESARAV